MFLRVRYVGSLYRVEKNRLYFFLSAR